MSRNSLYALIGILAVVVVAFGIYIVYIETRQPGLEVRLDADGIEVTGNG